MTIKEMDAVIQEHCRNFLSSCDECIIDRICSPIDGCFDLNEDACQEAYNILTDTNPYWERINAIAEQQRAKGMNKYGVGLESNPAAIMERINHLQEELIDGLMYCEWIKDHLKELEG